MGSGMSPSCLLCDAMEPRVSLYVRVCSYRIGYAQDMEFGLRMSVSCVGTGHYVGR